MTQRTLVLLKPDTVRRGLVGEVLSRFETKGLTIVAMQHRTIDAELADRHYAEHVDRDFYPPLRDFVTSGPLVALVLEGRWADMALPIGGVTAAMLHLALLGIVFGALALAIGAAVGHASEARAVPAVVAVLAYIVNGLAPQVSWLQPVRELSPFYQFNGHDPLRNGVSVAAVLVAVGTTVILVALAVDGFRRRDVAA